MDDVEGHVAASGGEGFQRVAADFLAAIVASSDDAIYSKDREALVTSWNRAAERLYGYTAEEVLGRPVSIIIPPDKHGEEFDILNKILTGEHVDHYATHRRRKDGSIVEVSISVSPVHDETGEIVEAAVIGRNITEQRSAERRIKVLQEERATQSQRQALELNDEVIQGLAAAKLALETGEHEKGVRALTETLARAQALVSRLLNQKQESVEPGDLVRGDPADI